jgi:hypothetical protein
VGHYDVLGVPRDASAADVRRAYLALARRHHPDRVGGSHERMRVLNEAWAVLGDPALRRVYDRSLTGVPPPAPARPAWGPVGPEPEQDEEIDDLFDDRPIGGVVVRLPGWLAMLPPGLMILSFATILFGLLLRLPPVAAFGLILAFVSLALFITSPLLALAASRRGTGGGAASDER